MTLTLYLTRLAGASVLGAAAVLLTLALGLDALRSANELVAAGGGGALALYSALRAPALAAAILPLAALLGGALAFLALAARSELTAMRAAGLSTYSLLLRLAPLALALGAAQGLLADRGASWSERVLSERFGAAADAPAPDMERRFLARLDGEMLAARLASPDGRALAEVAIFRLDADGLVRERIEAPRAERVEDGWALEAPRRVTPPSQRAQAPPPPRIWRGPLEPETARALATRGRTVSAAEAQAALAGEILPTRSPAYLRARLAESRAALAAPAVMLMLAALAARPHARGGGAAPGAVGAVALGFAFAGLQGAVAALARVGALAPQAVYAPAILFALAAAWLLIMIEERGR